VHLLLLLHAITHTITHVQDGTATILEVRTDFFYRGRKVGSDLAEYRVRVA